MRQMFRIGEVAGLFGLNVRTLRYYDEIGLLKPLIVDEATGYRYYAAEQFEQLNTIRYLRAQGVPLEQIAAQLHPRSPEGMLALLRGQQRQVELQLKKLRQTRARLAARVGQIEDAMRPELLGRLRIETMPPRTAALLRQDLAAGDDLELPLRQLENAAGMSASIFLGKVGLTVPLARVRAGSWSQYNAIICLAEPGEKPTGPAAAILPKGQWALWRFAGTHTSAPPQGAALLAELARQGLAPAGDGVEFTLVDYGLTEDPALFVTELQLPVRPL